MSALELKAYEIFKNKFGEKDAETVVEYFESRSEEKVAQKTDGLASKQDLKADLAELRADLEGKIALSKVDVIKWMVALWITQIAAIVGLYLTR